MRAFFECRDGRKADLCQYIRQETTRLTIRNVDGSTVSRTEYRTWDDAMTALENCGDWKNSLR